jgi:uncharacterized protein (DUF58 family)
MTQYTRVKPKAAPPGRDPRVYADLDELVRLQFAAQGFSFLPRQPVHSILYGRHASRLRGRGLNFEELRAYVPGDDIRNVDWKATARAGEPTMRVYTEERDRPVWLLVNQRQSMFFGARNRTKSVTAAEVAALTAWRVLGAGDRVGALVFDDNDIQMIRPQRSREQVMRVLGAIVKKNHQLNATSSQPANPAIISQVLEQLRPHAKHDCLICMIGDGSGFDARVQNQVTQLNEHNDLIFAMIYDSFEAELPDAGPLTVSDAKQHLMFDSGSRSLRERYQADFAMRLETLKGLSRKRAIPLLPINTDEPVAEQIRHLLGQQERGRRV